ncbi:ATP-dependent DNA helicase RecG [Cytophagales bacterium LB-30]|uniref:ATP-dependent DNA helicase RecG n=1 Tax=Shiella aurantiaca TaxID=3058365 RepID=A0ABT8F5C5_9BACT|nr:ATP-dependent DNA helicase RecG [Shiella aurantiaca]MDN4165667.1 ATP-dependent DNA helicase RecG [Shiella aurantiaca]
MRAVLDTQIEFLKVVGPQRAALLQKELGLFTYRDLLQHYPFRYEDKSTFYTIRQLNEGMPNVQVKGYLRLFEMVGEGSKKRLVGHFKDETGEMELVWFKGIQWVLKKYQPGIEYIAFGKPNRFGTKVSMAHPELDVNSSKSKPNALEPVYPLTEKLKAKYIDSKTILSWQREALIQCYPSFEDFLPQDIRAQFGLIERKEAFRHIHFPQSAEWLQKAKFRLKFEELFLIQLKLLTQKLIRLEKFKGFVCSDTQLLHTFYNEHLPFELTNAQKRVIKEAYTDMKSGKQMNRLIQGDVGSGKTMVAFICILLAIGNGSQAALMAPTEILADQHLKGLLPLAEALGISIALLTGSTKTKERRKIHEGLVSGELKLIIGTHALLEDTVQFKQLGLAVIDEQHRFGVAQRAQLWKKNEQIPPHILVMTATPIPRTLAMTIYGDLEISVIDELPAGRKPIQTVHRYESSRLKVFQFLREEIEKGRQVYIVYPLIEESEKMDLKDLMDGYESISRAFPSVPLSIVHGKMKAEDKEFEMRRFVKGETKIMVATTVIEVGINVPNASIMLIENAERFGLSQLHQLRGRVGRGAEQSYCILMSSYKLSKDSRVRIETMVSTNDGFQVANTDMQLRGPGDLMGTQQSGIIDLRMADLVQDGKILEIARQAAQHVLDEDPHLTEARYLPLQNILKAMRGNQINWSRVS